jgi:hypothetical protein
MAAPERTQVFISYSPDAEWLTRLQTMLRRLTRNHTITVWDDTCIRAGGNPPRFLNPHNSAGLYRGCLGWRGGHRPPSSWALLHIRVVGLGLVAIVPI